MDALLAPEVGDAEGQAERFEGAPDLLGVDADVDAEQGHAADGGNGLGDAQTDAGEHFKVPIRIALAHQGDVAVALEHALEHLDVDARLQDQIRVPLQVEHDALDDLDGVLDLQIGGRELDAGEAQLQLGLAVEDLDDAESRLHGQLQRRQTGGHKDRIVDIGDAAAETLQPDGAAAVDVQARIEAAHVEVDLVGDGDVVAALEAQLGLHGELLKLAAALQAEGPVVDRVDLQRAADLGQGVDHVLDRQRDLEVQADKALAAAEEDVRHHDGGRDALLGLLVVVGGVVHADVGQLFIAAAVVGVLVDARAAPVGPELLHLPEVGVRRLGVVLLLRALHELEVQTGGEADHAADLHCVALIVLALHDAELTVGQLEDHAGQLLAVAVDVRPDQGDGIGAGVLVGALAVVVVGDEVEVAALLQLGQGRLALPDGGARIAGVELAVELAEDGGLQSQRVALGVVLIVDGHRARLEVQAVVDRNGVVHPALAVLDRLLADGGVIAVADDLAAGVLDGITPVADERAAVDQQRFHLGVLGRVVGGFLFLELLVFRLILEGHQAVRDRVLRGGPLSVTHRGDDAVGVVAVLRVVGDVELQDLGGLDHAVRGDDVLGDGFRRPVQLHAAGAERKLDALVHHDVGHAVREGDVALGDHEVGRVVHRGQPELTQAGRQHRLHLIGVAHRHIEVADALMVERFRAHGVEVDQRDFTAGAGQEDVDDLLAQQVFLEKLAVVRVVVHGDGDALIARVFPELCLEIEILLGVLVLIEGRDRDLLRLNAVEVQADRLAVVPQGAQAGGGADDHDRALIVDRAVADVVLRADVDFKVGYAGFVLADKGRFARVQLQTQRRGQVDGHAFGVQHIPVERDGVGRAQAVIQGAGAVRRQILVDGVGEVQIGIGREVEQRGGQVVPVADGDAGRRGDHAGLDPRIGDVVHSIEVADGVFTVVAQDLLGLQGGIQGTGAEVVIPVVLAAEAGVQQDTGPDGLARPADGEADGDQTVVLGRRRRRGKREGLREGDAVDAPGGGDGLAVGADVHVAGGGIGPAEEVVLVIRVIANAEGDERGVVLPVVIEQVLVVVGLLQTVAFDGADQEAAVFRGHVHLDVAVVQGLDLIRCGEDPGGQQGKQQDQAEEEAQKPFQVLHLDHLLSSLRRAACGSLLSTGSRCTGCRSRFRSW